MMSKIGVLIADDHPLVREGVRKILSTCKEIEVLGEASNGEEALALALEKKTGCHFDGYQYARSRWH